MSRGSYVGRRAVVLFPKHSTREQGGVIVTDDDSGTTIRLDSGRVVPAGECLFAVVGATIDASRDPGGRR